MITAAIAKQRAEENRKNQLVDTYNKIEGQASVGRTRVTTDSYLTEEQQKELEDNGYKITKLTTSECHLIEW